MGALHTSLVHAPRLPDAPLHTLSLHRVLESVFTRPSACMDTSDTGFGPILTCYLCEDSISKQGHILSSGVGTPTYFSGGTQFIHNNVHRAPSGWCWAPVCSLSGTWAWPGCQGCRPGCVQVMVTGTTQGALRGHLQPTTGTVTDPRPPSVRARRRMVPRVLPVSAPRRPRQAARAPGTSPAERGTWRRGPQAATLRHRARRGGSAALGRRQGKPLRRLEDPAGRGGAGRPARLRRAGSAPAPPHWACSDPRGGAHTGWGRPPAAPPRPPSRPRPRASVSTLARALPGPAPLWAPPLRSRRRSAPSSCRHVQAPPPCGPAPGPAPRAPDVPGQPALLQHLASVCSQLRSCSWSAP